MMKGDPGNTHRYKGLSKKTGLIAGGLFLLYVTIGFWIAPPLLRPQIEKRLTTMLGRKVTIDAFKLNPLVLSATTSNLTIHEMVGKPFAGFKELYVNVQLSSLFRWAGTVKEIRLSAPFGILRLMPDGKLNINDLIARFSQQPPQSEEKRGLPRAILARLEVIDGKFTFEDLASAEPIRDVITPITFTLENFSTLKGRQGEFKVTGEGPIGGTFDLSGNLELNPPMLQGHFTTRDAQISHHWEHLKNLVSFQITKGRADIAGDFFASIDDNGLTARLENGTMRLNDFELVEKGRQTVLIALPVFSIEGIQADLKTQDVTIDRVQTAKARIHSWLSADGTFAIQQMLLHDLKKLSEKKAVNEPAAQTPPAQPWQVTLKKMEVTDWGLDFEDRTLTQPAMMSIDGIRAVIENLSTQKNTQATVGVTMQVNRAGQVKVDGSAGIDPLKADMTVVADKISLKPFQPYVDDAVNARIVSGTTSSKGRIRYLGKDAQPQIRYAGEFSVDALEIQDQVQTDDFVTLARLKAGGIELDLLPNELSVSNVRIDRPHASVTIDEAGVINVIKAFTPVEEKKKSGEEDLLKRLVNFLIMEFKGPMPIQVDQIRLQGFTANFMDASVAPTFKTRMEITEGTVSGLSSEPSSRADFKLGGRIDRKATINASGSMNPMNALKYSKVNAALRDFGLESISPYSGKYIGYQIAKGTLHTTLTYNIDDDRVQGDNIITIDGLELGKSVDSPDALNLPIKLGVALLKDNNDRIALQVPVAGNVQDPRFDIAKAIKSALTGTIEKAGSEPFAAIKPIDGFTGEQLKVVAFAPGESTLTEKESRKLNALASYLTEKDDLILGIEGTADSRMDTAAITGALPEDSIPEGDSQEQKKTSPETARVETVDTQTLETLARQRAASVSAYLIDKAGIDSARLDVRPVKVETGPKGETGLVIFSLSVK